jgi:hypothetical protein
MVCRNEGSLDRHGTRASRERMTAAENIPVLKVNETAIVLAEHLVSQGPIPKEFAADALHIAIAALNGIDCNEPESGKARGVCRPTV